MLSRPREQRREDGGHPNFLKFQTETHKRLRRPSKIPKWEMVGHPSFFKTSLRVCMAASLFRCTTRLLCGEPLSESYMAACQLLLIRRFGFFPELGSQGKIGQFEVTVVHGCRGIVQD